MFLRSGNKVFLSGFLALGVLSGVVSGCLSALGDFELSSAPAMPDVDASTSNNVPDGAVQQQAPDGGPVATPIISCETPGDCPFLETTPAGCAVAVCTNKVCSYQPIDRDGDGHPMAACRNNKTGQNLSGDDCDDSAPLIFPGAICSKTSSGADITFPKGVALGACRYGQWTCTSSGPSCQGAVGPAPSENCSLKNDADCDGVSDNGCDCTYPSSSPCGNAQNLPSPCRQGTRQCLPEGKWGACSGNVEPKARDCGSTVDNNCNSTPDSSEPACKCGSTAQGASVACTVPNTSGPCASGSQLCQPSPDRTTGVLAPCTGPAPQPVNCNSLADNNCNGAPDELEVACGSRCKSPNGTRVAAVQKFVKSDGEIMWGCPGTSTWAARDELCAPGTTRVDNWAACPADKWNQYMTQGGKLREPTHHYWTATDLGYGSDTNGCFVTTNPSVGCAGSPMRICADGTSGDFAASVDTSGNTCNWNECGFGVSTNNGHYGGCSGNTTAGTLCCRSGLVIGL